MKKRSSLTWFIFCFFRAQKTHIKFRSLYGKLTITRVIPFSPMHEYLFHGWASLLLSCHTMKHFESFNVLQAWLATWIPMLWGVHYIAKQQRYIDSLKSYATPNPKFSCFQDDGNSLICGRLSKAGILYECWIVVGWWLCLSSTFLL